MGWRSASVFNPESYFNPATDVAWDIVLGCTEYNIPLIEEVSDVGFKE
jgi:hypothetical protein